MRCKDMNDYQEHESVSKKALDPRHYAVWEGSFRSTECQHRRSSASCVLVIFVSVDPGESD